MVAPIPNTSGREENETAVTAQSRMGEFPLDGNAVLRLAEGMVHDFNNLLYPIIGYTEIAMNKMPEDSQARTNLEEVLRAAARALDLVQQFLSHARQKVNHTKPIQIQWIIDEVLKFLRGTQPDFIEIRKQFSRECGWVLADPTQIHRVIMNLCTNACHAMRHSGGVLELVLSEIQINPDDSCSRVMTPGEYLRLTVKDTGQGIDGRRVDQIFSPFFTTKPGGEGTGLGLFVVLGIVKSYGGHVSVSSEPKKGTAVNVYLPRFEDEPSH